MNSKVQKEMITIDKASFKFIVSNEKFPRELYGKWDSFCRVHIENVIEEVLSHYDKSDLFIQIDSLKLDLASIPENEFDTQFPIRLREELKRQFLTVYNSQNKQSVFTEPIYRFKNLISLLLNGYPTTHYVDKEINLSDEVRFALISYPQEFIDFLIENNSNTMIRDRLVFQLENHVLIEIVATFSYTQTDFILHFIQWLLDKKIEWQKGKILNTTNFRDSVWQSILEYLQQGNWSDSRDTIVSQVLKQLFKQRGAVSDLHLKSFIQQLLVETQPETALLTKNIDWQKMKEEIKNKERAYVKSKKSDLLKKDQSDVTSLFKDITLSLLSSQSPLSLSKRKKRFSELLQSIPMIVINYIQQHNDANFIDELLAVLDFTTLRNLILSTSHSHSAFIVRLVDWMRQNYATFGSDSYSDEVSYKTAIQKTTITFLQNPAFFSGAKDDIIFYFLRTVYGEQYCDTILLKLSALKITENTSHRLSSSAKANLELQTLMQQSLERERTVKEQLKTRAQLHQKENQNHLFENSLLGILSLLKNTTLSLSERQKRFSELLQTIPVVVIDYIRQNSGSSFIENLVTVLDFTILENLILSTSQAHSALVVRLMDWMRQNYATFGSDNYADKVSYNTAIQKSIITFLQSPIFFSKAKDDVIFYFLHTVYGEKQCTTILLKLSAKEITNSELQTLIQLSLERDNFAKEQIKLSKISGMNGDSKESLQTIASILEKNIDWKKIGQGMKEKESTYTESKESNLSEEVHLDETILSLLNNKRLSIKEKRGKLIVIVKNNPSSILKFSTQHQNETVLVDALIDLLDDSLLKQLILASPHASFIITAVEWMQHNSTSISSDKDSYYRAIKKAILSLLQKSILPMMNHEEILFVLLSYVHNSQDLHLLGEKAKQVQESVCQEIKTILEKFVSQSSKELTVMQQQEQNQNHIDHTQIKDIYKLLQGKSQLSVVQISSIRHLLEHTDRRQNLLRSLTEKEYVELLKIIDVDNLQLPLILETEKLFQVIYRIHSGTESVAIYILLRELNISLLLEGSINTSDWYAYLLQEMSFYCKCTLRELVSIVLKNIKNEELALYQKAHSHLKAMFSANDNERMIFEDSPFTLKENELKSYQTDTANKAPSEEYKSIPSNDEFYQLWQKEELGTLNKEVVLSTIERLLFSDTERLREYWLKSDKQQQNTLLELLKGHTYLQLLWIEHIGIFILHRLAGEWMALQTVLTMLKKKDDVMFNILSEMTVNNYSSTSEKKLGVKVLNELSHSLTKNEKIMIQQVANSNEIKIPILGKALKDIIDSGIENNRDSNEEQNISVLRISNAGLALLSPWLPRVFKILGLLKKDGKDFKDRESKIRAIFILQRMLYSDDNRMYNEYELVFNRLLTACPFYVPLPKSLELTDQEKEVVDSLLQAVKQNWDKLKNTSISGFQESFLRRYGHINQDDDKWMVCVDPMSYDMLLDSLPWAYKLIRYSWLKKPINVEWR